MALDVCGLSIVFDKRGSLRGTTEIEVGNPIGGPVETNRGLGASLVRSP